MRNVNVHPLLIPYVLIVIGLGIGWYFYQNEVDGRINAIQRLDREDSRLNHAIIAEQDTRISEAENQLVKLKVLQVANKTYSAQNRLLILRLEKLINLLRYNFPGKFTEADFGQNSAIKIPQARGVGKVKRHPTKVKPKTQAPTDITKPEICVINVCPTNTVYSLVLHPTK